MVICALCVFSFFIIAAEFLPLLQQANILVDGRQRPLISGFHTIAQPMPLRCGHNPLNRNANWRAPDTHSLGSRRTKANDIYAFGVMCLEVSSIYISILQCAPLTSTNAKIFTGDNYEEERTPLALERPKLHLAPQRGPDDDFWGLLCKCWSDRPRSRPTISEICNFPVIAKKATIRALNRFEDDFSSKDPASDEMRGFILTIQSWLIDIRLSSSLYFLDLERMFSIILEKCPTDIFIKIIHDEYSTAGRTCLIDILHEVAMLPSPSL